MIRTDSGTCKQVRVAALAAAPVACCHTYAISEGHESLFGDIRASCSPGVLRKRASTRATLA